MPQMGDETANPPRAVSEATRVEWQREARERAAQPRTLSAQDVPPGFDPDDERKYTFRLPSR